MADNTQDSVRISMKVWQVDDDEPPLPQFTDLVGEVRFPTGGDSRLVGEPRRAGWYTSPAIFDITFDDIYFTPIPEPTSASLTGLGLLGLAVWRRRGRV